MAKLTLNDVASGYNRQKINDNFTEIEAEFQDKVLYRNNPDGEPNQMETDIDMNSQRIYNLPDGTESSHPATYRQLVNFLDSAYDGFTVRVREARQNAFAGQTVFNFVGITYVPGVNNIQVYVNGVAQVAGIDYTETDEDTITFSSGLEAGDAVDVYSNEPVTNISVTDPIVQAAVATLEDEVKKRVIRVSSRTEMKAYDVPVDYQFSLEEGGRSGLFVVKAGTPPKTDPEEGVYVVLANGNYAERIYEGAVLVTWFGAVGNYDKETATGTDDTDAIQAAFDFLKVTTDDDWADNQLIEHAYFKKLVFPSNKTYFISEPILAQDDHSNPSARTILSGLTVEATGAEILMAQSMATTPLYFDTISAPTNLKAGFVFGPKDHGKTPDSVVQTYVTWSGGTISGQKTGLLVDSDLICIYADNNHGLTIENVVLQDAGFGFKGRRIVNSLFKNIYAYYTTSILEIYNDTPQLDADDPNSTWRTGGDNANNNVIQIIRGRTPPSAIDDTAENMSRAAVRLFNAAEFKIDDLVLFGIPHGLIIDGYGTTADLGNGLQAIPGTKWGTIGNVEIADTQGFPWKIEKRQNITIDMIQSVWCQRDDINSPNLDYFAPYGIIEDCELIHANHLSFDRNKIVGNIGEYKGGDSLSINDSTRITIGTVTSLGSPGSVDATYSHVVFAGTTNNSFINQVNTGFASNPAARFVSSVVFENNTFDNGVSLISGAGLSGTLVDWGTSTSNHIPSFDIKTIGSGATPDVTLTSYLRLGYSVATDITNFTNFKLGQVLNIGFINTNATIKDVSTGGNVRLAGAADFTPNTQRDTITLIADATEWREVSRSIYI